MKQERIKRTPEERMAIKRINEELGLDDIQYDIEGRVIPI